MTTGGAGTARPLPLDAWHRARGARFEERRGRLVPADYGDPVAEARILAQACGLLDRSDGARLELVGADRQRFLNGLVTIDVRRLEPGGGAFGYATGAKGQVLADVAVHCLPDRLWLELPPGREADLRRHLEAYVVADRVDLMSLEEMLPLTLIGPGAEAALERAGAAAPPSPWGNLRTTLFDHEVQLARNERLGAPAITVWTPSAIADETADLLIGELGAAPVGDSAAEALRIAVGLPRWGVDFGPENLPQELADDAAIDYRKGCYLGQEVVARLHYRGQAPRLLRSLVFSPGAQPSLGAEIRYEGRSAGTLTSLAPAPTGEHVLGLAILQRRAAEPGTRVELEDGSEAVVTLPGAWREVAT